MVRNARFGTLSLGSSLFVLLMMCVSSVLADNAKKKKPQKEWGPVKEFFFVCADNATILVAKEGRRVVDADEMESVLREASKEFVVYPRFMMTRSGFNRFNGLRKRVNDIYKDLYDAERIRGISQGSLSPRSYVYWDRIKTDDDFWVDADTMRLGRVVDEDGKPVKGAQAFLLPKEHINGVYLRDGFIRNPLEEHLVYTDVLGKFRIDLWPGEHWVVALCKQGFVAEPIANFEGTINLKLKPWASVRGKLNLQDKDLPPLSKFPISISTDPIPGIGFRIYETEVASDGSFLQKYVPPVTWSRHAVSS